MAPRSVIDKGGRAGVRGSRRYEPAQAGRDDATPEPWTRPDSAPEPAQPGTVVRSYGKFFDVRLRGDQRTLLSTTRGSLRRRRLRTDLVAVGDRVWVTDIGSDEGQIEAVEPRSRVLSRLARNTDDIEQVILANPDQALFMFSVSHPQPHRRMLDRFLLLAESRGLPAMIAINKIDLTTADGGERDAATFLFEDYRAIYPAFFLSVRDRSGIEPVLDRLRGRVTVVAGPSGVGKSSFLNLLDPTRERVIGEISEATRKGRHTTTATVLYEIEPGTFVADTPGIRALAVHDIPLAELDSLYPEMRPFLGECFYPDCTHRSEPGCAVRDAVSAGPISRERYESYLSLRSGIQEEP